MGENFRATTGASKLFFRSALQNSKMRQARYSNAFSMAAANTSTASRIAAGSTSLKVLFGLCPCGLPQIPAYQEAKHDPLLTGHKHDSALEKHGSAIEAEILSEHEGTGEHEVRLFR
jgi:hypothetical protein